VFVTIKKRGEQNRCVEKRLHRFLPNI
jgi:hypothetical protein